MNWRVHARGSAARRQLLAAAAASLVPFWAVAATTDDANAPQADTMTHVAASDQPEQVYVWGLRQDGIGQAQTSSEGIVSFANLEERPILRPGEIAEVIPGLAVTQHSGSGKANQYFMRGFNLDHGTDFSAFLDGVPLNLPTHAHGQGYLDLNSITPEMIETIQYRKGTYFADVGDFSAAGTAAFETFAEPPSPYAEITAGENDYYRLLGVEDFGDNAYVAVDLTANNGPWVNPEDMRKINVLGRFNSGNWAFATLVYSNTWNSTDQVPLRAIDDGLISRFGAIDPSDGGKTSRFILSARNENLDGWDAVVYAQKYNLELWSDFTYFLDDPAHGDQFEQLDDRWVYGGTARKSWADALLGWTLTTGAEVRDDDIAKVALYHTQRRMQLSTVKSDAVNEWSGALWTEVDRAFGPIRASIGIRGDAMGANVSSGNPLNSGSTVDAFVSPKATLAWELSTDLELYADAGRGFHSNDARGTTETVDPKTGQPVTHENLIVPADGAEIGARWKAGTFSTALTFFYLHLDSELVFSGDDGDTQSSNATQRLGTELLLDWKPIPRIDIDASGAWVQARYLGHPQDGSRVENSLDYMWSAGISALITDDLTATFTIRNLGPAPLVADGSAFSRPTTIANLLLRYQLGRFTMTGELLNVFDSHADDIEYFYASRLQGEQASGVDDYHIHPAEPRTWRIALKMML